MLKIRRGCAHRMVVTMMHCQQMTTVANSSAPDHTYLAQTHVECWEKNRNSPVIHRCHSGAISIF